MLRAADDKTNTDPWAPYCLKCSTLGRMTITHYGFKCEGRGDWAGRPGCGNELNHDCTPRTQNKATGATK